MMDVWDEFMLVSDAPVRGDGWMGCLDSSVAWVDESKQGNWGTTIRTHRKQVGLLIQIQGYSVNGNKSLSPGTMTVLLQDYRTLPCTSSIANGLPDGKSVDAQHDGSSSWLCTRSGDGQTWHYIRTYVKKMTVEDVMEY